MLSTMPSKVDAGIHVETHRGGLADLDAGEIGLLEVGVDPPAIGFDDGEERLAGLDGGAGPQGDIGEEAVGRGGRMGLDPVMGRLGRAGRRRL